MAKSKREKSGGKASSSKGAVQVKERRQREIIGVVWVALGTLLTFYLFFPAAGTLAKWLPQTLFGLFGWAAYLLPPMFIGIGLLCIKGGANDTFHGMGWFVALGVFAIVALIQTGRGMPYEDVGYMPYLGEAFASGSASPHRGGGFVGAALSYLLLKLGGNALAYTSLIVVILIVILAITRTSIRELSQKAGETLLDAIESTREEHEERAEERAEKRKMFIAKPDEIVMDEDDDIFDRIAKKREKANSKKARKAAAKPKPVLPDDALTFLPVEGELKTKTGKPAVIKNPEPVVSDIWDQLEKTGHLPDTTEPKKKPKAADLLPKPAAAPRKPEKKQTNPEPAPPPLFDADAFTEYEPPPFSLLTPSTAAYSRSGENPSEKAQILIDTLANFNIGAKITNITVGPVLTRFELQPAPGIRVSRITSLSNDIALALAAQQVRIEAPIPGKSAVGIEIPNKNIVTVVLRDIVESRDFLISASPVTMALGKSINGKIIVADLAKMPHMLIAGATGSGKSVCINDIIISLTFKSSPAELKMILIDPKMVELGVFGALPHMLIPVVTDTKKAAGALRWAVNEMMQRYKQFALISARDIARYNDIQELPEKRLPKIVVIIDELADLMLVAPDEVEDCICRIAQLGRAAGIHLIVATQRPDANVITGLIKANIPSRCAFAVSSGIDSRIILDTMGAEKLLGRGDMLFHPNGAAKPMRLQCAFVSDEEVERVIEYFKMRKKTPEFDQNIVDSVTAIEKGGPSGGVFGEGKQEDELLGEAVRIVMEIGQASISMIQRRLRVGYARAARLVDMMEQEGYVSGFDGSKARRVLIKQAEYEKLFGDAGPLQLEPDAEADPAEDFTDL